MAELVVAMVVEPLVAMVKEKASSYILDQYKVMEGMEQQHEILKRKLPAILDVITDAEQTAVHREGAKAWLEALRKVAYEANEVFDEFRYEALRRQAKKEGHYRKLGFDVIKLFPTHNRIVFRKKMGEKLCRIVQAVDVLMAEMNTFGFKYQQALPASKHWRQTDPTFVDPENIVSLSRQEEKTNIVKRLTDPANTGDLMVLPIVGMGGLGKTTLAQLIYNDPEIKKHFQPRWWFCVAEDLNVSYLARKICECHDKEERLSGKRQDGQDQNQVEQLQGILNGKRYLLVLDDVWNRDPDKWVKIKVCLQHGGAGSVVLVTTRYKEIARLMGTAEAHEITALSTDFIKTIIEKRSALNSQQTELLGMVDRFAMRCAGSPLAAKALGYMLRDKTKEEWEVVLQKSAIFTQESEILPILKLSYDDLPSHMKQCFAFCALFPKDYEIDVDKLIQLWIANGFIQEKEVHLLETMGKRVFNELASRSFFQDVKQVSVNEIQRTGGFYYRTTCKIHDLMHDVALSSTMHDTGRHLFVPRFKPKTTLNDSLQKGSSAIQTVLWDDGYVSNPFQNLSKCTSLKALRLQTWSRSFPLKPKHLRYLDLSASDIKAFPEDITILYNLQMLNLCGCKYLVRLPRQMKYMAALLHIYTHGCPKLKSMPPDLGKLTSLQTLTCFVAGTGSDCSNVGELQHLNLSGQLELCQLENVTVENANSAGLGNKKELTELTLSWTEGPEHDPNVLQALKPHDRLQAVRLDGYGGATFPTWLIMMQNMVEIHIFRCENVQYFFNDSTSFTFPNLKELTLESLCGLQRWWEISNVGQEEEILFPQLEKLSILNCRKLSALPGQPKFPKLENARIEGCPELTTRAKSPMLSVLQMKGHEEEMFHWVARHMTSLTNLRLTLQNGGLISASAPHSLSKAVNEEKWSNHNFPLTVLRLTCVRSGIRELCACFVALQDLEIRNTWGLVHWPEREFRGLVSLKRLKMEYCWALTGYAQDSDASTSSERSNQLPSLEALDIHDCNELVEVFDVPASLRRISVHRCRKLKSIFGRRQQGKPGSIAVGLGGQFLPCLEYIDICDCGSLEGVLNLPQSLKLLKIWDCGQLGSLECSGPFPLELETLKLYNCRTLSSLPDGPEMYSSLQDLLILRCPGIKSLPDCLHQRLNTLKLRLLDDCYYEGISRPAVTKPTLLEPKTWKYAIRRN